MGKEICYSRERILVIKISRGSCLQKTSHCSRRRRHCRHCRRRRQFYVRVFHRTQQQQQQQQRTNGRLNRKSKMRKEREREGERNEQQADAVSSGELSECQ